MPCYSVIKTKLTNFERLIAAARALGCSFTIQKRGLYLVIENGSQSAIYSRSTEAEAFSVSAGASSFHQKLAMKYAEIGVKSWAQRTGHAVVKNDGRKMQLINRRG